MQAMRLRVVALGLLPAGCSSSKSAAPDGGACAEGTSWLGGFDISVMDSTNPSPDLYGSVQDRYVAAAGTQSRTLMSDGPCQLMESGLPVDCTPSCAVGDTCASDGTCMHVSSVSVDTVRLTGWSSSPMTFEPI